MPGGLWAVAANGSRVNQDQDDTYLDENLEIVNSSGNLHPIKTCHLKQQNNNLLHTYTFVSIFI